MQWKVGKKKKCLAGEGVAPEWGNKEKESNREGQRVSKPLEK